MKITVHNILASYMHTSITGNTQRNKTKKNEVQDKTAHRGYKLTGKHANKNKIYNITGDNIIIRIVKN